MWISLLWMIVPANISTSKICRLCLEFLLSFLLNSKLILKVPTLSPKSTLNKAAIMEAHKNCLLDPLSTAFHFKQDSARGFHKLSSRAPLCWMVPGYLSGAESNLLPQSPQNSPWGKCWCWIFSRHFQGDGIFVNYSSNIWYFLFVAYLRSDIWQNLIDGV